MASLKEIKTRIGSVKNTLKITSSMKLVASAKLHRAQTAIEGMLPYSQRLELMLKNVTNELQGSIPDFPLRGEGMNRNANNSSKRIALVCVSSSTSLCGGFNNNLIRFARQVIEEYGGQGSNRLLLIPIGRKVAQALEKTEGVQVNNDFVTIGEKPAYAEASALSAYLTELFQTGQIDGVELLYTHYKNMAVQQLTRQQFLPVESHQDAPHEESLPDNSQHISNTFPHKEGWGETSFILEPSASQLLADLLPQALAVRLYSMLLDSSAAEHAARTFAMQQATDNGEALLHELNLQYNKVRQQAITNELLDIVGGSMR